MDPIEYVLLVIKACCHCFQFERQAAENQRTWKALSNLVNKSMPRRCAFGQRVGTGQGGPRQWTADDTHALTWCRGLWAELRSLWAHDTLIDRSVAATLQTLPAKRRQKDALTRFYTASHAIRRWMHSKTWSERSDWERSARIPFLFGAKIIWVRSFVVCTHTLRGFQSPTIAQCLCVYMTWPDSLYRYVSH